jgi:hypothetical protein
MVRPANHPEPGRRTNFKTQMAKTENGYLFTSSIKYPVASIKFSLEFFEFLLKPPF